jgi:preflagellin peptidase FlaK
LSVVPTPLVDIVRLVAVPVLGWAAYRDVKTRRVPNDPWYPLAILAVALLGWEAFQLSATGDPIALRLFLIRVAFSVFFVIPLTYGFWYFGGFGGADAKAFMMLALLLPTYPTFLFDGLALPLYRSQLGVFSLTVLTNTVLLALGYPLVLGIRNLLAGERSLLIFIGRAVPVEDLLSTHGSLLQDPDGFTRNGLDLDALRMYLRWRGLTLADLRAHDALRNPATLPDDPNDPGDGRVEAAMLRDPPTTPEPAVEADGGVDPWGASAFLAAIEGNAYGTTPAKLRDGIETVRANDEVWVSPGVPFIVPTFIGLLVGLTVGDLLFAILRTLGLT